MSREPSTATKPGRENVLDTSASVVSLSQFGAHLMTPIVTLYVGEERVKFLVHEGVLCKLKFFRSALKGRFRETSEMTINMPEDNPEAIAALIEHLQTEDYDYEYNSAKARQMRTSLRGTLETQDESLPEESPGADFAEALFALQVYVVADKYEYPELILTSREYFRILIDSDSLTDSEILWVWKFAYAVNLNLSSLSLDSGKQRTKTIKRARSLLDNYPEEMRKTMSEFTDLACDLMNIAFKLCECGP